MRFDHRRGRGIPVADAKLYVEQIGSERNPPLLLLHGGLGSVEDFNPITAQLSHHYRLVAIDARSHGASTLGTAQLSYQQLTEDVLAVMDRFNLESANVLGFSDGGIVGYRLAIQAPERVQRLIAIGSSCRLTEATSAVLGRVTPSSWDEKFPDTRTQYSRLNPQADFDALVRASVSMWTDKSQDGYPGDEVRRISSPTLLVRGDDDHLFSLDEASELRRLIRNSHLLNIPFAGHVAFATHGAACIEGIRHFIRDT